MKKKQRKKSVETPENKKHINLSCACRPRAAPTLYDHLGKFLRHQIWQEEQESSDKEN